MTASIAHAWTWPAPVLSDRAGIRTAHLRTADNDIIELAVTRWHDEPDAEDLAVLARATGPVLDVGCGPGRHVAALVQGGVEALGIDTSQAAVAATRRRGAPAVKTSIFGPVPDAGSWATIPLLDGRGRTPPVTSSKDTMSVHEWPVSNDRDFGFTRTTCASRPGPSPCRPRKSLALNSAVSASR